jgi:PKD repeat protein
MEKKMKYLLSVVFVISYCIPCLASNNIITQQDATNLSPNTQVERWNILQLKLEGTQKDNPFVDVLLSAEFKNGGKVYSPQGFYDGSGIYIIRFMPTELGQWNYITKSNRKELDGIKGTFTCVEASQNNHGPVRVRNKYYLAYEDGTPYFQLGTTCYAWAHQGEEMEQQTLRTLTKAPFNKMRMCVFPKDYVYNKNEPVYYPFEGEPLRKWDFTRFDPEFWRHFETRVMDLLKMGIEADIILYHTYDRWGFESMDKESDDRYIRYAVARLSAFRNVWWSLANEYDIMPDKKGEDWDRFFQIIQKHDPYQHLRGIHNCVRWYDHNKPWVTHASIQTSDMAGGVRFRQQYQKPVIYDECKYEGNIPHGWGQLTPEQMVKYFWMGTLSGCYVGHGETYLHPEDLLWWSKGGVLRGKSPERIAFLKDFMSDLPPYEKLKPMGDDKGNFVLGIPGKYYLVYGKTSGNSSLELAGDIAYKIDAIDTWNMKELPYGTAQPGTFTFASPKENMVYRFTPYAPGEKIRPEVVATADVIHGDAPLTVKFSSSAGMKTHWDFGDGSTSQKSKPTHVFKKYGRYLVSLTVTDNDGLSASTALAVTVLPPAPENLNKFSSWPGSKSGMQFVWQNDKKSNAIEARDDAKINDIGEMVIGKGAFVAHGINDKLKTACQKTNQVTVEAVVTISKMDQSGPARIISFSKDSVRRNFTLGQEGKNIVMRLRTPRTGANGLNPQASVCQITRNEPMHLVVSYYPDNLHCYLNGELVYQGSDVRGDFSNWEPCQLILGDEVSGDRNWIGKIQNIAIYNRFVGPEEAGYKYKLLKAK